MRDLVISLQEEIQLGSLSFREIAVKYEVPLSWVNEAWDMLCEQECAEEHSYDHLERDCDEDYVPDCDSWYEDQYDLGD